MLNLNDLKPAKVEGVGVGGGQVQSLFVFRDWWSPLRALLNLMNYSRKSIPLRFAPVKWIQKHISRTGSAFTLRSDASSVSLFKLLTNSCGIWSVLTSAFERRLSPDTYARLWKSKLSAAGSSEVEWKQPDLGREVLQGDRKWQEGKVEACRLWKTKSNV